MVTYGTAASADHRVKKSLPGPAQANANGLRFGLFAGTKMTTFCTRLVFKNGF